MKIARVVSGGQTGADLAALDAAVKHDIPCGGWVPKGRINERGLIPARYPGLMEAGSARSSVRTALNVRDADATLIISYGELTGGSHYTLLQAQKQGKPCLHIDLNRLAGERAVEKIAGWLQSFEGSTLNVAGPRASEDARIYEAVYAILGKIFESTSKE